MDGLAADVVTGWPAVAWLAAWTVPLSVADVRTGRLPAAMVNRLMVGLVALTLAAGLVSGSVRQVIWSFAGAATFGGLLLAVRSLAGDGLGGGDVRLAVPLGWFLGATAEGWSDIVTAVAGPGAFPAGIVPAAGTGIGSLSGWNPPAGCRPTDTWHSSASWASARRRWAPPSLPGRAAVTWTWTVP